MLDGWCWGPEMDDYIDKCCVWDVGSRFTILFSVQTHTGAIYQNCAQGVFLAPCVTSYRKISSRNFSKLRDLCCSCHVIKLIFYKNRSIFLIQCTQIDIVKSWLGLSKSWPALRQPQRQPHHGAIATRTMRHHSKLSQSRHDGMIPRRTDVRDHRGVTFG